jgi:hypothetical protein
MSNRSSNWVVYWKVMRPRTDATTHRVDGRSLFSPPRGRSAVSRRHAFLEVPYLCFKAQLKSS